MDLLAPFSFGHSTSLLYFVITSSLLQSIHIHMTPVKTLQLWMFQFSRLNWVIPVNPNLLTLQFRTLVPETKGCWLMPWSLYRPFKSLLPPIIPQPTGLLATLQMVCGGNWNVLKIVWDFCGIIGTTKENSCGSDSAKYQFMDDFPRWFPERKLNFAKIYFSLFRCQSDAFVVHFRAEIDALSCLLTWAELRFKG